MARSVLLFSFVATMSRIVVYAHRNGRWFPGETTLETEREFRIVQTFLLLGLVMLLAYYAIPVGRNLKGIILGYGVFLSMNLVQLTLRDFLGDRFQNWWLYIQPVSYIIVLLIWCKALWIFASRPDLGRETRIELDYRSLAHHTKRQLRAAGKYIAKVIR
jgi:hypothetical protein